MLPCAMAVELGVMARVVYDSVRICLPTVVDAARGSMTREVGNERLRSWSGSIVAAADLDIRLHGTEPVDDEVFVVMSNHQSLFDIVVLYQAIRRPLRMVAKAELFRIPLFGPAMRDAGFVFVDRTNRRRALASLELANRALETGMNIWIAPEGTRSRGTELGEFKRGGFHVALTAGVRILPVTLLGTGAVMRSGSWEIAKGRTVDVHVHAPVDPAAFGKKRLGELVAEVRSIIQGPLD